MGAINPGRSGTGCGGRSNRKIQRENRPGRGLVIQALRWLFPNLAQTRPLPRAFCANEIPIARTRLTGLIQLSILNRMKPLALILTLYYVAVGTLSAQLPGNSVADQIQRLREAREKAIQDSITKVNNDYAQALSRLEGLYPSDPVKLDLIKREKDEVRKLSLVSLPPALKITAQLGSDLTQLKREKPQIHTGEQLERHLIGT